MPPVTPVWLKETPKPIIPKTFPKINQQYLSDFHSQSTEYGSTNFWIQPQFTAC